MDGKVCTAAEAVADVQDGAMIAAHVWGAGTPGYLFRALVERGVKDLTVCFNNFVPSSEALRERGLADAAMLLPQVRKITTAFIGTRVFAGLSSDFLGTRVEDGTLEVEATTHGTLIERLHAGAMRLGGFYNPVGVGTVVAEGKETRVINGVEYVFEEPIRPDVGLVKASKADRLGNLVYHGSARGSNPIIAMASEYTIAEVFEIVEPGELDPDTVVTPGIYVDRIVRIPDDDPASDKSRAELFQAMVEYAIRQAEEAAAAEAGLPEDRQDGLQGGGQ